MIQKEKLDKIAKAVIEQIGDLKLSKHTISSMIEDDRGELMAILVGTDFVVTQSVPLINLLYQTVDRDSFGYIMDKVGNHLSSFLEDSPRVSYDAKFDLYYYFKIFY